MTTTTETSPASTAEQIASHIPNQMLTSSDGMWLHGFTLALTSLATTNPDLTAAMDRAAAIATSTTRRADEAAIHNAAERVHDENPLIVIEELGRRLGHRVEFEQLMELAEVMGQTTGGEDRLAITEAFDRRDYLTHLILTGPVNG